MQFSCQLGTMESDSHENRWKCFLQASRSFLLNPPKPSNTSGFFFLEAIVLDKSEKQILTTESSFLIVLISNSARFSWIPGSEQIHLDLEKPFLLSDSMEN